MPATLIPSDVWDRLDPNAGGLARRQRRGVLALLFALLLVMTLAVVASAIGLVYPRIDGLNEAGTFYRSTHDVRLGIRLVSGNYVSEHVSGMTVDDPNFQITSVAPSTIALPAHTSREVSIRLHIRDCSKIIRNAPVPLSATTDHWWGHQTRSLTSGDGGNLSMTAEVAWDACHGAG